MFIVRCDVCNKEQEVLPIRCSIPCYIPPIEWYASYYIPKSSDHTMLQVLLCSLTCLSEHHRRIAIANMTGRPLDELDNEDFSGRQEESEEE